MHHFKLIFVLLCFTSVLLNVVKARSKTQALRGLLSHFSAPRNNRVNRTAKQEARDFIVSTFKEHELITWTEETLFNDQFKAVTIVGQLPGRYTGTRDDKIVLIGAHYDTVQSSPGVDDNGSGMAALLQTIKLVTSPDKFLCARDHTLLFVAFDLEEYQSSSSCSANGSCCVGITCGSRHFVHNFTSYLNTTGASLQGAFILDTIMNYNTTPNSQNFPDNFNATFPEVDRTIKENQNRGTFLFVIGRQADDKQLMDSLKKTFQSDENFHIASVPLTFTGRPRDLDSGTQEALQDFFRSDHTSFWNVQSSLPAVFITDTADYRGYMQQCYHQSCDDMDHVTPEMLTFLARTTDSLVGVAAEMTNERCYTRNTDCGPNVTSNDGVITTPQYPTQYPNNVQCAWTISVDAEQTDLRLEFTTFDLEESANCTADFVEIRDGNNRTAPLIGKFCGTAMPEPVKASAQSLFVLFHSDELDGFKGFRAEWSSTPPPVIGAHGSSGHPNNMMMWPLIGSFVLTSFTIG